jgi:hypothetical protein
VVRVDVLDEDAILAAVVIPPLGCRILDKDVAAHSGEKLSGVMGLSGTTCPVKPDPSDGPSGEVFGTVSMIFVESLEVAVVDKNLLAGDVLPVSLLDSRPDGVPVRSTITCTSSLSWSQCPVLDELAIFLAVVGSCLITW